jgi:hypothetical protein
MHRLILGAGGLLTLLTLATLAAPAAAWAATCPPAASPVTEVFIAADCADCWSAPAAPSGAPGWRLDWITPTTADAPLAAAALLESRERADRAAAVSAVALRPSGLRLKVVSGPAWNGYFGLQLTLQRERAGSPRAGLPAGSTGWLALVELLPAGAEGSPLPRALVRSVAGPLPLAEPAPARPASHLRALRWPEGARPERLQARAWIEAPSGQVLLMAADGCP